MSVEIVITGMGLISALGDDPAEVHAARCEGRSAVRLQEFPDREAKLLGARIEDFDPKKYLEGRNLRPLDRAGCLAVSASKLAFEAAGITPEFCATNEVDMALGTTFGSVHTITQFDRKAQVSGPKYAMPLEFANTVVNAAAGQTAIWHNLRGTPMTVSAGTVSGLRAIEYASRQIAIGRSELYLAGGFDEHCFESSWAFRQSGHASGGTDEQGVQPFGEDRRGFAPGEGAGFLVLESAEGARKRGAKIHGTVQGWGSGYAPIGESVEQHVSTAGRAISAALEMAGCSAEEIGYIGTSANGSIRGDDIELQVLRNLFGERLGSLPIAVPAEGFGNPLAASGIFQAIEALESGRQGTLPPFRGALGAASDLGLSSEVGTCKFTKALLISVGLDGSVASVVLGISD